MRDSMRYTDAENSSIARSEWVLSLCLLLSPIMVSTMKSTAPMMNLVRFATAP